METDLGHFLASVFYVELCVCAGTIGGCEGLVNGYGALGGAAGVVYVLHNVDVGAIYHSWQGEVAMATLCLESVFVPILKSYESRNLDRETHVHNLPIRHFLGGSPYTLGIYMSSEGRPCAAGCPGWG